RNLDQELDGEQGEQGGLHNSDGKDWEEAGNGGIMIWSHHQLQPLLPSYLPHCGLSHCYGSLKEENQEGRQSEGGKEKMTLTAASEGPYL
ncbi:hypothetical protein JZ751_001927, partial [Albula glossodonta]